MHNRIEESARVPVHTHLVHFLVNPIQNCCVLGSNEVFLRKWLSERYDFHEDDIRAVQHMCHELGKLVG